MTTPTVPEVKAGGRVKVTSIEEEAKYEERMAHHLGKTGTVRLLVPGKQFPVHVRMDDGSFQVFRETEVEAI